MKTKRDTTTRDAAKDMFRETLVLLFKGEKKLEDDVERRELERSGDFS